MPPVSKTLEELQEEVGAVVLAPWSSFVSSYFDGPTSNVPSEPMLDDSHLFPEDEDRAALRRMQDIIDMDDDVAEA
ncbi:unnamed protein product [Tilletia controversa]|nr:unnamed protein product [Tilletia controversa]